MEDRDEIERRLVSIIRRRRKLAGGAALVAVGIASLALSTTLDERLFLPPGLLRVVSAASMTVALLLAAAQFLRIRLAIIRNTYPRTPLARDSHSYIGRVIVGASGLTASVALLTFALSSQTHLVVIPVSTLRVVSVLVAIVGLAQSLLVYLRGDLSSQYEFLVPDDSPYRTERPLSSSQDSRDDLRRLRSEVSLLWREVDSTRTDRVLGEDDKTALLASLRREFADILASEYVSQREAIREAESGLGPVRITIDAGSARLRSEIAALGRRGNLNLVIGILTTLAAATLLVLMVSGHKAAYRDSTELLAYYIPRLSTAVFVEVFGFFFLRLYKNSLAEIKFYQNELTSLALVSVSVDLAAIPNVTGPLADVARTLSQCDRNASVVGSPTRDDTDDSAAATLAALAALAKMAPSVPK